MAAHLDHAPRLASLPGPSRLVRISEPSWTWLRQAALGVDVGEPTPQQRTELVTAGLLMAGDAQADETASDPTNEGAVELEPHWQHAIATGLDSPVGVELVCLDGTDAWTTRLRFTGRTALLVDQVHAPEADGETVRLSHRSSAVTLGIASMDHIAQLLEAVVPQRPAFTDAEPAPVPEHLIDAPAVAEVQALVVASPTPETTVAGGGSFYAVGEQGEHLIVLEKQPDGAQAKALAPRALTTIITHDLIAAINHVAAVAAQGKDQA